MAYHIVLRGGLGDALMTYLEHPFFKRLPAIKEKIPGIAVHVYSEVTNNGVEDLFWYHPVVKRHIQIIQLPQSGESVNSLIIYADPTIIPSRIQAWEKFPDLLTYQESEPIINLNNHEQKLLNEIYSKAPFTVIQPTAGMPDRDAFTPETLNKLCEQLPGFKVIVGNNAPRVGCYRKWRCNNLPKDTIDLFDVVGVRFNYHLMKNCNAFIGTHSCGIVLAWYFNKPNVCILPKLYLENNYEVLDTKYKFGENRVNTLMSKINTKENQVSFDYNSLNYSEIATHINKYMQV